MTSDLRLGNVYTIAELYHHQEVVWDKDPLFEQDPHLEEELSFLEPISKEEISSYLKSAGLELEDIIEGTGGANEENLFYWYDVRYEKTIYYIYEITAAMSTLMVSSHRHIREWGKKLYKEKTSNG